MQLVNQPAARGVSALDPAAASTMPDIDPAALSRPTVTLSTPVLSSRPLSLSATGTSKAAKASQIVPARVDLETAYASLKAAVSNEHWLIYKESIVEFLTGRLSQAEYSDRLEPILGCDGSDRERLHNQLVAALFGNVTREMPDQGIAPWVSANDKPMVPVASKPVTGDASERRLKGDVMLLPARDRRRIKDLSQNDYDPHEALANTFLDLHRRPSAVAEAPSNAAASLNKMNFDLEIRKRFAQPLAVESGEFPDLSLITDRMLSFCYGAGLAAGDVADAPHLVAVATETFIKETLTQIFSRTRSNGPGNSASASFGVGTSWIQTRKYQRQLRQEEEAALRGEVMRDKSGLLPVEAKAASERRPLDIADMRLSLEISDTGMAQFPVLMTQLLLGYRAGELESWDDYTLIDGTPRVVERLSEANKSRWQANGHLPETMDLDPDPWWEGAETPDTDILDGILDLCLSVRS